MNPERRQAYLDAMGIQAWVSRERLPSGQAQPGERPAMGEEESSVLRTDAVRRTGETALSPGSRAGAESQGRLSAPESVVAPQSSPKAGGFPSEMLRAALSGEAPVPAPPEPEVRVAPEPVPAEPAVTDAGDLGDLDWPELAARAAACRACDLHQSRTQAVFGVGDHSARLMIVGEAPGADEDRQGEPFVGRAGQLLNAMLAAIGLERGQVYIANILKCRPPGNRDPQLNEAAACRGYLDRQIALVKPDLILCLGAVAAHNLLATELPVGKLRGRWHELPGGERVAVTYHPAYLLRRPEEKVKAWQDLQRVAGLLRGGPA